jgi:hypothetical protein
LVAGYFEAFAIPEIHCITAGGPRSSRSCAVDLIALEFNATHPKEVGPIEILVAEDVAYKTVV